MRTPNPDIERSIREKALALLMEREPEEIGMREIATAVGITATTIYYYYADKERLLEAVKKDCIALAEEAILSKVREGLVLPGAIRAALSAFRDWAFENPRIALLMMNRFRPNLEAGPEEMAGYYRSTYLLRDLIARAVAEGTAASGDPLLDASLCIAAVWGAIESILRYRTLPEYWDRGVDFTDEMIELCCARLAR